MPKRKKRGNSKVSLSSVARSIGLLRSEVRIGHGDLQTRVDALQNEMRTGFDQLYRHIDGFVKLHETLDLK